MNRKDVETVVYKVVDSCFFRDKPQDLKVKAMAYELPEILCRYAEEYVGEFQLRKEVRDLIKKFEDFPAFEFKASFRKKLLSSRPYYWEKIEKPEEGFNLKGALKSEWRKQRYHDNAFDEYLGYWLTVLLAEEGLHYGLTNRKEVTKRFEKIILDALFWDEDVFHDLVKNYVLLIKEERRLQHVS